MSLQDKFQKAAAEVANFKTVDDDSLYSAFYSLYKQATSGDCTAASPSGSDARSVAKHNAWVALKGTSKESAMEAYVKKYEEQKGNYKK